MEAKKHYKLYKSGKKWCCMALTTMAAVIGVATAHQTIHADVTSDSANVQQTSVNTNQNDAQSAVATNASSSDTTTNTNSDVTTNTTTQSDVDSTNSQETNTTKTATNTEQTNDTNSQSNTNTLSVKSLTTDSKVSVQALSASAVSANSTAKNGWYNENGQEVYYENGQTKSGEDYIYVQSMDNANTKNWYLVNNGVAQSGLQKWAGTYYYFNPTSYLKETNTYQQVNWSNGGSSWYMFGNDGAIVSDLYQQDGTYYYYDPSTYLRVTNNYVPVTWSNGGTSWYMFGNDGKIVTGLYKWAGSYYYFSPSTYEKVTNNYIPVTWSDGGTSWYMFGNDGRIVTGLYKWYGSYYYFSPSTYEKVTNNYIPVTWPDGGTSWYMFDETGRIVTGLKEWYGSLYYFSPSTYEKVTNTVVYVNGQAYQADSTGKLSKIANSNQAFLASIKQAAEDGWKQYGVLPSVTAAQAIIESAWGRSALATQGHNLFGIKGSYNGQSITMRTAEYGSGGYYYINAAFRKYPSNYESVVDHGRFLATNSRYRNLLWDTSYTSVTAKLQQDGYATSPTYASTLNRTIRTYGLDAWDKEVIG